MDRSELKTIITLIVLFLIVAFFSFLIINPLFESLLWAIVIGYLLYPVNNYFSRFVKNENLRASLMLLAVIIGFIFPIFIFLNTIITNIVNIRRYINLPQISAFISEHTSEFLGSSLNITLEMGVNFLVDLLKNIFLALPQKLLGIFVMFFALFYIFKSGKNLSKKIISMVPIQEKHKELVLEKFSSLVYGSFYTIVVVSILQSIFSLFIFILLKIPAPWFWALLVLIAGLLPFLGAAAVYIPIAIYLFYMGSYAKAAILIIYGTLLLSIALDLFLKQRILSTKAKAHPLIILIGIIGGIQAFGLLGIILGPLILIILKIFFEVYIKL